MDTVSIRPALPADATAIRNVIAAAYAPWRARLDDLPDVTAGIEEDIASGGVWVADIKGRIAGCLFTGIHDDGLHIRNIAVDPADMGTGLGTALMHHATHLAHEKSLARLHIATHREMSGNVSFYQRLGWRIASQDGNKVTLTLSVDTP